MNTCKDMGLFIREKLYLFIYYLLLNYYKAFIKLLITYPSQLKLRLQTK